MKTIASILDQSRNVNRPKNITTEFQLYGVYICEQLGDTRYSLYIKLAKNENRNLLEEALTFTKGYANAKNKGKLFLWKLKQLRDEAKAKQTEKTI